MPMSAASHTIIIENIIRAANHTQSLMIVYSLGKAHVSECQCCFAGAICHDEQV